MELHANRVSCVGLNAPALLLPAELASIVFAPAKLANQDQPSLSANEVGAIVTDSLKAVQVVIRVASFVLPLSCSD
jgi:hypothetical protein